MKKLAMHLSNRHGCDEEHPQRDVCQRDHFRLADRHYGLDVPAAGAAKIVVIILMTWLIALGDTTHIVVGSVEILYLVFNGTLHWSDFIWPFALPTLAGNICGGTFIFALMSHAQIRNDMSNKRKAEARQKAERAENIKKNYKNPA
ncbi:transporter protein [Escherichia coli]|uniref:Transporter protein n=1 Tax=Escherichia coli TaxID=562 RepID=A0A377BV58_ECOLX|nr:transporter protein [Escherichia coli]